MQKSMCVVICLLLTSPCRADLWPGFLGQGATAVDASKLPLKWSPESGIAWKTPLQGYGQSSPIIVDQHVYLTSVSGENKEKLHISCLDLASGELLWERTAESTFPQKNSLYISRAAPTPVASGQTLICYFESGDVLAFDHQGELLWQRSLVQDYGALANEFGLSASPVLHDGTVVILVDDDRVGYLVALEEKSGQTRWKTDRKPRRSWSSPALVEIEGEPQIVCSSAGAVEGYELATGQLLWSFDQVGGNTATTPLSAGVNRFLVAASPGRDGENQEMARKSNGVMQVRKVDNKYTAEFAWTQVGPTPSWASPIVHQGLAYWINRTGVVYCLDAESGDPVYTERIAQAAWATPLAVGDRIYCVGKSGQTTVLRAGRNFEVLAENQLWSDDNPPVNRIPSTPEETAERQRAAAIFAIPTVYGYAVAGGSIVFRTGSQVFCVR